MLISRSPAVGAPHIDRCVGVVGAIQDMTMVEASTMVVSYQQRSAAEQAAFALQGLVVGGRQVGLALYYSGQDPQVA